MKRAALLDSALDLPARERHELASALWQSLEGDSGWLPEWQMEVLDDRLASSMGEEGEPWSEVRAALLAQR